MPDFLQEKRDLMEIASQALDSHGGNFERAENELTVAFSGWKAYRATLMRIAAHTLLSLVRTTIRTTITTGQSEVTERVRGQAPQMDPRMMEARLRNAGKEWLDFPLVGGRKRLGDAVYADLEKSESYYSSQGRTMLITGTWFRLVKNSLPDTTSTVRDVLTNEKLEELHSQASQATLWA